MKHIIFLLLALIPESVLAGNVTEEQARETAVAFWQSARTRSAASPSFRTVFHSENLVTRSSEGEAAYYVFGNESEPGFVIVAGDDVAVPVLAYSFEHDFSAGDMPENLRDWLVQMRGEINRARRQGAKASERVARSWASTRAGTAVVGLETALWNQEGPYNAECPPIGSLATYTGCTATALAIVMRYHQWPECGTGTLPAYTTATHRLSVDEVVLGEAYDWTNMRLEYASGNYTQREADAVATLMRDCAVGLQSDFGPVGSDGTTAYSSAIPSFLTTYMDYDRTCRYITRNRYNTGDWHRMMRDELDNSRPVIYRGNNDEGGHAFVLDGYDSEGYFSVNWGWGGASNGYFLLSALDPYGQGAGGSDSGYNDNQGAVVGIQENAGGGYVEDIRFVAKESNGRTYNGFATVPSTVRQNVSFVLYAGFATNLGSDAFSGEIVLAVTDRDGQIVETLYEKEVDGLLVNQGYNFTRYACVTVPILAGYRLRAYYRSERTPEWTLITGNDEDGCAWDYLIADEHSIEETTTLTYEKKTRTFTLRVKDGVTATLQATGGSDYSSLCRADGNGITIDASSLPGGSYLLTLQKEGETKTLTLTLPETAE